MLNYKTITDSSRIIIKKIIRNYGQSPTAEAKDLAAWFPGNGLTESGDQPE